MSESVINVSELTRRFGAKTALASVSLSLPRGAVYGLVGANGAGKTTLIRHVLGLLRAESGSVRVFGLDPVASTEDGGQISGRLHRTRTGNLLSPGVTMSCPNPRR